MARVLVIDDDEIGRLGRAAILGRLGHEVVEARFDDVADGDHGEGRVGVTGRDGPGFDVVLAVVRPDHTSWDRFASIAVLGALRERLGPRPRLLAVVIGRAVDNPVIGLRLARAGVGELVHRCHASTTGALARLVDGEARGADPRPGARDLAVVGLGADADPEAVVAWVLERAETSPAHLQAFEPGVTQNRSGLSRRQAIHLRVHLSRLGRVRPDPSRSGGGPVRNQSLPRWSEVVAVTNLCRGCTPEGANPDGDPELPGFDDGGWWEAGIG